MDPLQHRFWLYAHEGGKPFYLPCWLLLWDWLSTVPAGCIPSGALWCQQLIYILFPRARWLTCTFGERFREP